ncbi:MAG: hypothetical protein ACLSA2_00690 [Candidatus Gastranaerophilaceae bacterium]
MAFKIAGSMAIKEGVRKAKPCILEPMMKVEIEVPEENTGDIIGDISSRRGRVEGMEIIEGTGIQKINAIVPLGEMFGYATDIRSKTQGRGTFSRNSNATNKYLLISKKKLSKNQALQQRINFIRDSTQKQNHKLWFCFYYHYFL